MLFLTKTILIITLVGDFILLFFLLKEHHSRLQVLFTIYTSAIIGWTFAIFINLWLESIFVEKLIFAFATIFLVSQFWFAKLFTKASLPKKVYGYWSFMIGIVFVILSFWNNALFTSVAIHTEGYTILTNGPLMTGYFVFSILYAIAPIVFFVKRYRITNNPTLKMQLKYLIVGFSVFLFVNIFTNMVLPVAFKIYFFNAIGPVFSLFLATSVFYIIWRHQFLNITLIIQLGLIYSILFILLVIVYFGLLFGIAFITNSETDITSSITAFLVMIIGVFTVPFIERYFRKKTDKYFFKDKYNYSEALQRLTDTLTLHNTPKRLVEETAATLKNILKVKWVLFTLNEKQIPKDSQFSMPIKSKNRLLGSLSLGQKLSGDRFRKEDIKLLETLASGMRIALEKAELYNRVNKHAKELEQKVIERTKNIEDLREKEKNLMGDISHAVLTPLTVLKGNLKKFTQKNEEGIPETVVMEESVDKISKLIRDLLKLSKIDAFPISKFYSINISELMYKSVEYVETLCKEYSISVKSNIEKDLFIQGNEREIEELITNILSNAVRYTKEQSTKVITVNLKHKEKYVVFSISDTGIGISEDKISNIFERFYRVSKDNQGFGLGLAICKKITERHNGTISAESKVGQGTTFTVTLPVKTKRS